MNAAESEVKVYDPVAWLGLVPLFVLDEDDDTDKAIQAIMDTDVYSVFYILGENHETETVKLNNNTTTTVTHKMPRLFKVVKNLVGNAVATVENTTVQGLKEIDQIARFELPRIPFDLIREVDAFFRKMHDKHGTEAIILFTYDKAYLNSENPNDGWGVIVPKQENTAASCDYDPTSAVDLLPDDPHEVHIVGSAHSHPLMSAYCSGTDKADQAEFDGIHITFGWSAKSLTEWHIELQMGGAAYTMTPEQTYEGMPEPLESERLEEWGKNVVKKHNVHGGYGHSAGNPTHGSKKTTGTGGLGTSSRPPLKFDHLPKDLPEPDSNNTVIAMPLLQAKEIRDCPVCLNYIPEHTLKNGKCNQCQSYIVPLDVGTVEQLKADRKKSNLASHDLDFDNTEAWKSVWLWEERFDEKANKTIDEIECLREGKSASQEKGGDSGKADGLLSREEADPCCPNCLFDLLPGQTECDTCGYDKSCGMSPDEWVNAQLSGGNVIPLVPRQEHIASENQGRPEYIPGELVRLNNEVMLCCNNTALECTCQNTRRMSFAQADDLIAHYPAVQPYKEDEEGEDGCSTCLLKFTAACELYVDYLATFSYGEYNSPNDIQQVEVCADWTSRV